MSAPTNAFQTWFTTLPIPWLTGGPNGQKDATAQGIAIDQQVGLIKFATTARMPDLAPSDALPHIGGDRQLEQGPSESNASFATRLKTAWDDWARAGTALELLVQLYWGGFGGAVIAQQNGLLYSLSGAPTAGVDPTSLLQVALGMPNPTIAQAPRQTIVITCSTAGTLGTAQFGFTVNGVTTASAVVIASATTGTYYAVPGADTWVFFPAGTYALASTYTVNPDGTTTTSGTGAITTLTYNAAPWWQVDANAGLTNRFVVLFPGTLPAPFSNTVAVTFNGTQDYVDVVWPKPYADTSYQVSFSLTTSDAAAPIVYLPVSRKSVTGVRVATTARFTGEVDLQAWTLGANPFADPHADDLARLRRLIARWKPQKSLCGGIYAVTQLSVWDYAPGRFWDDGLVWWDMGSSVLFGA